MSDISKHLKAGIEEALRQGMPLRGSNGALKFVGLLAVAEGLISYPDYVRAWLYRERRKMEMGAPNDYPDLTLLPEEQAKAGDLGYDPVLPGFEIKETTTSYDRYGAKVRQSIKQTHEPGEDFEVPANHHIKGISALLDADGRTKIQWVKTKENAADIEAAQEAIKEFTERHVQPTKLIARAHDIYTEGLTAYWVGDHHLGMYAWKDETGASYDLNIGRDLLLATTTNLVTYTPPTRYALIISVGDFFHTDTSANVTPKSKHPLDIDTRRSKVFGVGIDTLVNCIELALQHHDEVEVVTLPGNHDPETTPTLAWTLYAWFRNNPRVKVSLDPSRFYFRQFHSTMICSTHGDMAKMKDLPLIMASQQPQMWGETKFRYGFTGHIHHASAIVEHGGVRVESVRILPPADSWNAGMGYGAGRSMLATVYSPDGGEVFRHTVNITS